MCDSERMNKLTSERRAQILGMMVEGNSIRAIVRMMGVSKNTVVKLLSRPPANGRWTGLFAWDEGCGGKHARKIEADG